MWALVISISLPHTIFSHGIRVACPMMMWLSAFFGIKIAPTSASPELKVAHLKRFSHVILKSKFTHKSSVTKSLYLRLRGQNGMDLEKSYISHCRLGNN